MQRNVAIIILNYNGAEDTIQCITSLKQMETKISYNIFVLDNASEQENFILLKKFLVDKQKYRLVKTENFDALADKENFLIKSDVNLGFARGNNIIVDKIKYLYSYIVLLNNDTIVNKFFVQEMILFLENHKEIQFASCRINNFYKPEELWNCGGKLCIWGNRKYFSLRYLNRQNDIVYAEFITGCALFIRSDLIKHTQFLTNDFFFGEEDFNFCWRMKKEHIRGACLNKTLVYHKVSSSSKKIGAEPNRIAVHFSNRIIDMKHFYKFPIWYIWKYFFLSTIKVKCILWGINIKDTNYIISTVKKYALKNELTKDDFTNIMNRNREPKL